MKFVKICKKHVLPMAGGMFSIAKKTILFCASTPYNFIENDANPMKPICVKYGFRVSAILKNIYILKNLYRNSKKTMIIKNHALPMAGAMFSVGFKPYIPVAPPQQISLKMMKI